MCRQWDPVNAKIMYLNMAKWRTENDIENLYQTYDFPELDEVLPLYAHFYHKVSMTSSCHDLLLSCN